MTGVKSSVTSTAAPKFHACSEAPHDRRIPPDAVLGRARSPLSETFHLGVVFIWFAVLSYAEGAAQLNFLKAFIERFLFLDRGHDVRALTPVSKRWTKHRALVRRSYISGQSFQPTRSKSQRNSA